LCRWTKSLYDDDDDDDAGGPGSIPRVYKPYVWFPSLLGRENEEQLVCR